MGLSRRGHNRLVIRHPATQTECSICAKFVSICRAALLRGKDTFLGRSGFSHLLRHHCRQQRQPRRTDDQSDQQVMSFVSPALSNDLCAPITTVTEVVDHVGLVLQVKMTTSDLVINGHFCGIKIELMVIAPSSLTGDTAIACAP